MTVQSARKGREEPRLWTRPLRDLTPQTSLGYEAVEFSERILNRPLHPWQKWFLIHSLELAPGSTAEDQYPTLRFKTVVLLVARQNGKSYIMSTRLLWRMMMWEGPEIDPPLVLGTAHKLSAAKEIMSLCFNAIRRSPSLQDAVTERDMRGTNGQEQIVLPNGSRYKIEAASDDGGRSLSVTDLGFDELRQQKEWSPWAALTNTTNAVHSSQIIGVSNAGEAKSDVLRSLRQRGIAELDMYQAFISAGGDPSCWKDHNAEWATLGLFEYSAPDDADIWDRDAWAQSNPSMGYVGGPTETTIAAAASLVGIPGEGMPEHKFRTEIMCQWVNATLEGPFPQEALDQCLDPETEIDPASPVVLSVDVSADRGTSYVAAAGWRDDGDPHVEIIAKRAGTEWIPDYLSSLTIKPEAIVVQGKGAPVSAIIPFIEKAGTEVTRCEGSDLPASCGQFSDRVMAGKVHWGDQPALLVALKESYRKHFGDVWSWDRQKSPVDASPLCAVTFALWGLTNEIVGQQKETAYGEDYGEWWLE